MDAFPETIPELIARRAAEAPSAVWLRYESATYTLGDVVDRLDRVAVGLADRGVVHGDRVAALCGNRPETLWSWFGANQLGAIAAVLNPALKRPEIAALFRLMKPRIVVVDEHRPLAEAAASDVAADARPTLVSPAELLLAGRGAPRVDVRPEDVAVLLATSGTTGAPKAVMQSHRTFALTAEAFPWWLGLGAADRLLVALPLFHINAQAYGIVGALGAGAGVALLPKFSASRFWEAAKRHGATQFNAVGAMLRILMRTAPSTADRDHAVRLCYAALALPESEHRAFEQRFGLELCVGYGMSETTFGTKWPRGEPPRHGTMGRLRQHPRLGDVNRARVVRDDGSDAPDGENGELWLSNPGTMSGYFGSPAETAVALADGWLHTGDVVRRDADGWFTFVSRRKEMLRRRGENVAAAEIENVLLAHPDVLEAAVVPVPAALGEDDIAAYVSPRAGASIDVEDLRAFAHERLAGFKVPSVIHVREVLPRTATERVAKHLLK